MVAPLQGIQIESVNLPLSELKVEGPTRRGGSVSRDAADRRTRIVLPDGRKLRVSKRFWSSFSSLYNLSRSVFDYFPHEEVFARVSRAKRDRVRLTCEDFGEGSNEGRLLSCTSPARPRLELDEVNRLVERFGGQRVGYGEGVATAAFDCPLAPGFEVGGDGFRSQVHLQMPLDGYGLPSAYLGLLRLVCTNGMVGLSRAFKTVFHLGKQEPSLYPVLERAMTSFNNEEGFAALRDRVDAATRSWASLKEAGQLQQLVASGCTREGMDQQEREEILGELDSACGQPLQLFGLTSVEELSERRARAVPVNATVYDLVNFASELATHRFRRRQPRESLQAWIGASLTGEYDLEGTVEAFPDYRDYFLAQPGGDASPAPTSTPA